METTISFTDKELSSPLIGAIDQGTSSTRFLIFAADTGKVITSHQVELKHTYPKEGWLEMNPAEIIESTLTCIDEACKKLEALRFPVGNIRAIGITNQRETTIAWNRKTGQHLYNAIVWCDMRTENLVDEYVKKAPGGTKEAFSDITGLPIHPYFSALKLRWLLDNVPDVKRAAEDSVLCAGTVDAWLIWNLTDGEAFVTDVTNASRTNLMNLRSLKWDQRLLKFYRIDEKVLPQIRSSAEIYGKIKKGALVGVPIAGCLGDQQAALVGEGCLQEGTAKSTYGTGCFMLLNTGTKVALSHHGLLTTVGYKFGPNATPYYALEGSVAVAGIVIRWLRDQLKVIKESAESESLAKEVPNTAGVYFVPAFSGLYAPYWHSKARGIICGLTQFTTKAHIARAALEAVCFQTREIVDAMENDTRLGLKELKVDGGMVKNQLLMQTMADILGKTVVRRDMLETSCLGAAAAAGHAVGVWKLNRLEDETVKSESDVFRSKITEIDRRNRYRKWKDAVKRSMNWIEEEGSQNKSEGVLGCLMSSTSGCCRVMEAGGLFIAGLAFGLILQALWRHRF